MSEKNTDNLIENKLREDGNGYPNVPDIKENGIVWYTQDSYKGGEYPNKTIEKLLSKASKSTNGAPGKPEFIVDTPNFYIVIEDKDKSDTTYFSGYPDVLDYIGKGYDTSRLYKCPIDDVLWYAEHLKKEKDVIAIANFSDGTVNDFNSVTYYIPKNSDFNNMKIVDSGGYTKSLLTLSEYKIKILELNGEKERTYEEIYEKLKVYSERCSSFMRKLGVSEEDRLGLVSIIVLALTNKTSVLRDNVKNNVKTISKENIKDALLSADDHTKLGVIVEDKLTQDKVATLKNYIDKVLLDTNLDRNNSDLLSEWDKKNKNSDFWQGNTILTRMTFSLYKNIIKEYETYKNTGIDIMGTFYSLFLIYYSAEKKKGIVLTPSHITNLFCDLAEYFGGKFTKNTKIMDICTGSGGFLIAALNRIDENIRKDNTLQENEKEEARLYARQNSLIGSEIATNMFMLAYANMRFHGDGKSTLYNLNSLIANEDSKANNFGIELRTLFDEKNELKGKNIIEVFKEKGADVGMINPPYGKDYEEYEFINAELKYLKTGGIGIAIVPVSNQGASKNDEKTEILQKHTLLASILMPTQLFVNIRNSGASVGTCILVFKAHQPHQEFLKNGGETFLADWREDGFKMFNKHGRFEYKNQWYARGTGYHDMYLSDMDKTVKNDFKKLTKLTNEYNNAFPDEKVSKALLIPSSIFKKDIHDGGIKSISIKIFNNPHTIAQQKKNKEGSPVWKVKEASTDEYLLDENGNRIPEIDRKKHIQKKDRAGNLKWKMKKKKEFVLDKNGNKIPIMESKIIYDNMDWNILDYVKTDYHELSNSDFIRTMRNYKLFQYMLENNMLFTDAEEFEESEE